MLKKEDIEYFDRGKIENPRFWSRFPAVKSFSSLKILDVGCGHGSMLIYLASLGAAELIGIDLDEDRIKFAKENLTANYPEFIDRIEFLNQDLKKLGESYFDIVISKDSFEHIIELPKVIKEIKRVLRKGGRLYSGFAPLYNTFNGDHGRTEAIIPWGHLIFPEGFLLKRLNRKYGHNLTSVLELGLNKLSLKEYKSIFEDSGMSVVYFVTNNSKNFWAGLLRILSKIPYLEEYFTYHVHVILQKETD